MENQSKHSLWERIRRNLYVIEAIELSGLAVLLTLFMALIGVTEVKPEELGFFWLGVVTLLIGGPIAALVLWAGYLLYIRVARAGGSAVDVGLWVLMAIITQSFTFWYWTVLDINRFILAKLFYQGEAPVEYAWSHGSKQRRQVWEQGRKAETAQKRVAEIQTVEPLITALRDKDFFVRTAAAAALGQLGDVRAVEPLIAALQDRQITVRAAAATALGQLADIRAVQPLISAVRYKNFNSSAAVAEIPVRMAAATALGQLKDNRAVEPLIAALREPQISVRAAAAAALGQLGDDQAIGPLTAALQHKGPLGLATAGFRPVRVAAATALGQLGDPQAVEALTAAFQDKDAAVQAAAAEALEKLGLQPAPMSPIASLA